jgi:hypothetical protein
MRNVIFAIILVTFGFLVFGCVYPGPMPGSDKDAYGCIPSAGYTWCEQKQKCVRQWEEPCPSAIIDAVVPLPKLNTSTIPVPITTPSTEEPNTQLPNPASVNCVQMNGSLRIVETESGQVGICTLPSGEDCEEWAFYRGDCPKLKVGNDTDEHGCIGSAGYAWCLGLQQCIRPWETICPVSTTPTDQSAGLPPSTNCVDSIWCAAKNKCIIPSKESC